MDYFFVENTRTCDFRQMPFHFFNKYIFVLKNDSFFTLTFDAFVVLHLIVLNINDSLSLTHSLTHNNCTMLL